MKKKTSAMDDASKIKVLMIYYDHWGKEELQARKTANGIHKTLSLLQMRFQTQDHTLIEDLQKMFHSMEYSDRVFFWTEFVNIFFQMKSFDIFDNGYYATEDGRMDTWKNRLCNSLLLEEEESILFLYNELSPQDVLSVDAIVALLS